MDLNHRPLAYQASALTSCAICPYMRKSHPLLIFRASTKASSKMVEPVRLELTTSSVQARRSPIRAMIPDGDLLRSRTEFYGFAIRCLTVWLASHMAEEVGFEPTGLSSQQISSLRRYDHFGIPPKIFGAPSQIRTAHSRIKSALLYQMS